MTFAFSKTHSHTTTVTEDDFIPDQAEIEREIAQLKEDSARDVERQLRQQRSAEKRYEIKEDVKRVAEEMEGTFSPVWKAAEQGVETMIKDAEVDIKDVRRHWKHVNGVEAK